MIKLLVEYNADLNIKNLQGYTPLTLAAHYCRKEVKFKKFICFFLSISLPQRSATQNLIETASITLLIKLFLPLFFKIFFYFLEKLRVNEWMYADISCATYPLENVDTIAHDGSIDTNSCLYIILQNVWKFHF